MRLKRALCVVLLSGLLAACLGGLIAQAGTQVLLAILKPMVGLDPNANGLFQQPIIKDRMQGFLGDKYEPVMQLLMTADKLQEEGPLFYVVSRYTPVPELAEKAGFVWNSDTNQMAVMLVTGGSPTVIAERMLVKQANQTMAEAVPQWPTEFQTILDEDAIKKKAAEAAKEAAATATLNALGVDPAVVDPTVVDPAAGRSDGNQ
ncbi:MAG TPA: hypothetical protein VLB90_07695 [Pseudomonadales bacterium]|nr:hypothetical protein [Pseudomonadales bacterium]